MKTKHYLILGAAALILAWSFFMPNSLAGVTDMRILDNLIIVDTPSISFDAAPELGLLDRLALAANSNTELVPLITGNIMDADAAAERVYLELERLARLNPWEVDFNEYVIGESSASLVIDTMIPALNMVVWDFIMTDPSENAVTVTVDDDTGVILRLVFKLGVGGLSLIEAESAGKPDLSEPQLPSDEAFSEIALSLTEMMADYYRHPVVLADYLFSESFSYYKAEISDSRNHTIPMYGVVRTTGFTMNERVLPTVLRND